MLALLITALLALDAPVTHVTVFTDQARVVRTAQVNLSGTQEIELPALRDTVDLASIRVEASGAEVRKVDIEPIQPAALRSDEAKAVLAEIDQLETERSKLTSEQAAWETQRGVLQRLAPSVPTDDPLKPKPRLNASGWSAAAQFASDQLGKAQRRLRELSVELRKLDERTAVLHQKAQALGNPQTTAGWKVTALVAGNGPATVTLTYLTREARWTPQWDLQLQPETNVVTLSLAAIVSQQTGEDWPSAALSLSTSIPRAAVPLPKLTTWKIGSTDRFIPTPTPVIERVAPPPKVIRPPSLGPTEAEVLRARLVGPSAAGPKDGTVTYRKKQVIDFSDDSVEGELTKPDGEYALNRGQREETRRPEPPKAPPVEAPAEPQPVVEGLPGDTITLRSLASSTSTTVPSGPPPRPTAEYSLAPPRAWREPWYGLDTPIDSAGGADLVFASLQKETVNSAKGARRVALWSQKWPVSVERKLFPALSSDAYLVAELKNPSSQVLPGGLAQLSVGADPAGTARLKLVSPGEAFTLPLGIDRAVKAVRNVAVVQATQGLVSKDELGTYSVSIEIANPYRTPIALRVFDQWPLTKDKNLEIKLLDSKPGAIQDVPNGGLEWRLTLAAGQKQIITFSYSVKRPLGWQLQQSEVSR